MNLKEKKKKELEELVRELRFNKELSIKDLASRFRKSERTIYRWLRTGIQKGCILKTALKKDIQRPKKYPQEIFNRIRELKKEVPQRSAPMIYRKLQEEFSVLHPSLSTIQKFSRKEGLVYKEKIHKKGYKKFQRDHPNDLWQIDIAGPQTIGHLRQLYLIALIDDCSRFVVAAQYFRTQQGINVIKIIRDAILSYGRPNQILSDNGTQFRNMLGKLGTKYSKLLEMMDITPIFAERNHPQTKGKLERWFETVIQMFLIEARFSVKKVPKCSLSVLNEMFQKWLTWYNTKKSHGSLPKKVPPARIFFESKDRIYRPLEFKIDWDKWLYTSEERKVTKYNTISYKGQHFDIPPGFSLSKVMVIEYDDKVEIYHKEVLIISHPYIVGGPFHKKAVNLRVIRKNGTISYKGKWYTIDYKLAGKTVEVQESNNGRTLLVYLNGKRIATLNV